jgi:hypothetical protein
MAHCDHKFVDIKKCALCGLEPEGLTNDWAYLNAVRLAEKLMFGPPPDEDIALIAQAFREIHRMLQEREARTRCDAPCGWCSSCVRAAAKNVET